MQYVYPGAKTNVVLKTWPRDGGIVLLSDWGKAGEEGTGWERVWGAAYTEFEQKCVMCVKCVSLCGRGWISKHTARPTLFLWSGLGLLEMEP